MVRDGYTVKINLLSEMMWTSWFLSHWFINGAFSSRTNGTPSNRSPVLVYPLFTPAPLQSQREQSLARDSFPGSGWKSLCKAQGRYKGVRTSRGYAARLPGLLCTGQSLWKQGSLCETLLLELLPRRGLTWPIYIRVEKTSGVTYSSLCRQARLTWSSGMNLKSVTLSTLLPPSSLILYYLIYIFPFSNFELLLYFYLLSLMLPTVLPHHPPPSSFY